MAPAGGGRITPAEDFHISPAGVPVKAPAKFERIHYAEIEEEKRRANHALVLRVLPSNAAYARGENQEEMRVWNVHGHSDRRAGHTASKRAQRASAELSLVNSQLKDRSGETVTYDIGKVKIMETFFFACLRITIST